MSLDDALTALTALTCVYALTPEDNMTRTRDETARIGQTILAQLGGVNRLTAMLGASSFATGEFSKAAFVGGSERLDPGVSFRIKARAKGKIQGIIITLNPSDLYDVEFIKTVVKRDKATGVAESIEVKRVEACRDIYADSLKEVIERVTGLYLSL